jgi:hypothetical protein
MIVKEYWWVGKESRAVKAQRWAKPMDGKRTEILNWFRAKETELDRRLKVGNASPATPWTSAEEIEIFDKGDN